MAPMKKCYRETMCITSLYMSCLRTDNNGTPILISSPSRSALTGDHLEDVLSSFGTLTFPSAISASTDCWIASRLVYLGW